MSKPQDYIKEIQIKTKIETENVQEELKEEILEDLTSSKWSIFDQNFQTSREKLEILKVHIILQRSFDFSCQDLVFILKHQTCLCVLREEKFNYL